LGEIGRFYFQTCFTIPNAHILLPERIFMLYRLQKIQTDLVNIGTGFQHQSSIDRLGVLKRFFTLFHPKEVEDMYVPVYLSQTGKSILNEGYKVNHLINVPYIEFEVNAYNRLSSVYQIVVSGKEDLSENLKKELAEP